jgi:hypothetical protein
MQTTHTFALGDRVDLAKAPHNTPRGPYEITALMPEGRDGEPQYGLRGPEGRERVVTETEILALREPARARKDAPPADAKAQREADKAERQAEAKSAWKDYIDERDTVLRRTAELRELRLKAEAEAAAKIMKIARAAAAAKAAKPVAKPQPAAKGKAAVAKPASKPKAAKPAAKPKAKATVKAAAKASKKPATKTAKPKTKAKPKAKAKSRR